MRCSCLHKNIDLILSRHILMSLSDRKALSVFQDPKVTLKEESLYRIEAVNEVQLLLLKLVLHSIEANPR